MFVSAIFSPTLVVRTPPHTTRSADAVRMAATMAPPSAQPGATRILVPEFPEVCEQTGITLTRYMCEVARANPELCSWVDGWGAGGLLSAATAPRQPE